VADHDEALRILRRRITSGKYPSKSRLPPERALAEELGMSRGTLRKALEVLESEGLVWRHVGKGTFVGHPAVRVSLPADAGAISMSPREILEARLMFEPIIAARAATSATRSDLELLGKYARKADDAADWEAFELWDRTLHRAIAAATQNAACLVFLDIVNRAREQDDWSRAQLPPLDSPRPIRSRAVHFTIVEAIFNRNAAAAAQAMRQHLERVRDVYFSEDVSVETAGLDSPPAGLVPRARRR
jgi:GntR family transcriptional repressor for pyruvate dehydrogenase complex